MGYTVHLKLEIVLIFDILMKIYIIIKFELRIRQ
jgi:hypothetical protein